MTERMTRFDFDRLVRISGRPPNTALPECRLADEDDPEAAP